MTWAWYVLNPFILYNMSLYEMKKVDAVSQGKPLNLKQFGQIYHFWTQMTAFWPKVKNLGGMVTFWFAHIVKPPSDDFCDCNGIKLAMLAKMANKWPKMTENADLGAKCLFLGPKS